MSLSVKQQAAWWSVSAVVFFACLWVLRDTLLPFVVGCALAYLLDPLADRLERAGLSRILATTVIALIALLMIIIAGLLLIPLLTNQLVEFVEFIPKLAENIQTFINETVRPLLNKYVPGWEKYVPIVVSAIGTIGSATSGQAGQVIDQVASSAMGAINVLMIVIIVPVVMIYMLADWDKVIEKIDHMLPRDHAETIRGLFREVNGVLAGFVRGQVTVCAILAAIYATSLSLVGLQFGFVIGCIAGLISFIPFVGSIGGGVLAVGVAIFQFWSEPAWIVVVGVIFFAGQILEGNFITPRLVGSSVRLHPVWLLFALSAFGSLFGFVGLLIAVPTAATIGVFLRFGVRQYLDSRLYKGGQ